MTGVRTDSMKLAVVVLTLLLATASIAAEPSPDKIVRYKKVGDVELKLHVFNPKDSGAPNENKSAEKRPAIVFFFGGGWVNGSPSQFYPHCEYFSARGMVAISAEYRVQKTNGTSPRECVKDGKSAIRWIRQHADELGIDPNKLAAGGGSAGGHVAAAAGTLPGLNEDGEDTSVSCRPDALVLFNPVFDNGPGGYGYDRVKDYWQEISPLANIDEHAPPTIVFLGTKDQLIPVSAAEKYKQAMTDKGRRCDLHLYDDQKHGFFNVKNAKYFNETVIEADRFLASLGFLQGEPTLKSVPEAAGSK